MPKKSQSKIQCIDQLRHAEYYHMQGTFDGLYAKSKNGETFDNLMDVILSDENIMLAYRNIKTNTGSNTAGTDKLKIKDIGCLPAEDVVRKVRYIVKETPHGYRPRPVRRKDIPKPNGSTRPLGIPCIWDRLVQQCIKQVMEPICEARFSENSYGFRPNRSVEHAIERTYRLMQLSHLHYVIEFDIKGFFDNVNHAKLIRQIWAMGIRDKTLLYIIRQILTAPIKMPDGTYQFPTKGTPQGGIISPLLANIVLNELDHWIDSQWQKNPVARKYAVGINKNGSEMLSSGYAAMRKTGLKEMYIVRYADDFRIFCRTRTDAEKTLHAVTQWLSERLKLDVSPEKTRIVNVKRRYSEFLGFKINVHKRGQKYVVQSHVCDKAFQKQKKDLTEQARKILAVDTASAELAAVRLYNAKVIGVQNYYNIATAVSHDCSVLNYYVRKALIKGPKMGKGHRVVRTGRALTEVEKKLYGKSKSLLYMLISKEPVYPIGYVQHKHPIAKKRSRNAYTPEGRVGLHDNLRINIALLIKLMRQPVMGRSIEYADNRISLFSAQWGKCAVSGVEFQTVDAIHCHHKLPKSKGGTDEYRNLILISEPVHKLIHATTEETILKYLNLLKLSKPQLKKLNGLRLQAGCEAI